MQKKNILIAILCVTILLLVPFTSISGASVGELNTKVEIVEEATPVIPYHMFEELVESINQLLIDYGDIPKVVEICNEALELIDPIILGEIHDGICLTLGVLFFTFGFAGIFFFMLGQAYRDSGRPDEAIYYETLATACVVISSMNFVIAFILFCEWAWAFWFENDVLKNQIDLNPQISPESFSEYDITVFQELFKSYEINCLPCMFE
jgi:hypothetical protein